MDYRQGFLLAHCVVSTAANYIKLLFFEDNLTVNNCHRNF